MQTSSRKKSQRGFTALEVLAAAFLGMLVTAVSLPFTNKLFTSPDVRDQLTATAAVFHKVRMLRSTSFDQVFDAKPTFENDRTRSLRSARGILRVEPSPLDPHNIARVTVTVIWIGRDNMPQKKTLTTLVTRSRNDAA